MFCLRFQTSLLHAYKSDYSSSNAMHQIFQSNRSIANNLIWQLKIKPVRGAKLHRNPNSFSLRLHHQRAAKQNNQNCDGQPRVWAREIRNQNIRFKQLFTPCTNHGWPQIVFPSWCAVFIRKIYNNTPDYDLLGTLPWCPEYRFEGGRKSLNCFLMGAASISDLLLYQHNLHSLVSVRLFFSPQVEQQ